MQKYQSQTTGNRDGLRDPSLEKRTVEAPLDGAQVPVQGGQWDRQAPSHGCGTCGTEVLKEIKQMCNGMGAGRR